uniref:Uncharacterized protein n=1 Tax=Tetraodon nigroviridis TaxID=99883 RepID=H3C2V4_TETNG
GNLCSDDPCDLTSARCNATDGSLDCTCNNEYIPSIYSDRACVACPSGQQAVDGRCSDCPFGYSGFNCAENWKLVLVIVGSVLGGVLLITLIVLVTVTVRSRKHSKSSSADIGKPHAGYSSPSRPQVHNGQHAPAVAGMPRIPRATANKGWNGGSDLEMTPSTSRQNLISERSSNNPYSQNRPQSNPYTANRGHDNPYYKYDSR